MVSMVKPVLVLLFAVAALLSPAEASSSSHCDLGWTYFNGHCFRPMHDIGLSTTWLESRIECQKLDSWLAEPETQATAEFLADLAFAFMEVTNINYWYLGLFDIAREGRWVLPRLDKEPEFTMWGVNYPSQTAINDLDCAMIVTTESSAYWQDTHCADDSSANASAFAVPICQKQSYNSVCNQDNTLGDFCYVFVKEGMTFDDAENNCNRFGGHLASVHSSSENSFLSSMFSGSFWLGASMTTESAFKWTDNTASDYANWQTGYPRCGAGCGVVFSIGGEWFDVPKYNSLPSFCKIPRFTKSN